MTFDEIIALAGKRGACGSGLREVKAEEKR